MLNIQTPQDRTKQIAAINIEAEKTEAQALDDEWEAATKTVEAMRLESADEASIKKEEAKISQLKAQAKKLKAQAKKLEAEALRELAIE